MPLLLYTGVMKNKYKIGDKVIVSFLGNNYSSEIIEVRHHPQQERIIYTAILRFCPLGPVTVTSRMSPAASFFKKLGGILS